MQPHKSWSKFEYEDPTTIDLCEIRLSDLKNFNLIHSPRYRTPPIQYILNPWWPERSDRKCLVGIDFAQSYLFTSVGNICCPYWTYTEIRKDKPLEKQSVVIIDD